jgi:hypothetical protein
MNQDEDFVFCDIGTDTPTPNMIEEDLTFTFIPRSESVDDLTTVHSDYFATSTFIKYQNILNETHETVTKLGSDTAESSKLFICGQNNFIFLHDFQALYRFTTEYHKRTASWQMVKQMKHLCAYVHSLYLKNHQLYQNFAEYYCWQQNQLYYSEEKPSETDLKQALIFYNDTVCEMSEVLEELKRTNLEIQRLMSIIMSTSHTGAVSAPTVIQENLAEGFQWINSICKIYRKYNGPEPCTCKQMLRFFQREIESISDIDFHELIGNIEYHLGNTTLKLIEQNFRHFVVTNYSAFDASTKQVFDLQKMLKQPK